MKLARKIGYGIGIVIAVIMIFYGFILSYLLTGLMWFMIDYIQFFSAYSILQIVASYSILIGGIVIIILIVRDIRKIQTRERVKV